MIKEKNINNPTVMAEINAANKVADDANAKKAFIYNITALKKAKQIFSNLETLQRVHITINQKVVKIKEIF